MTVFGAQATLLPFAVPHERSRVSIPARDGVLQSGDELRETVNPTLASSAASDVEGSKPPGVTDDPQPASREINDSMTVNPDDGRAISRDHAHGVDEVDREPMADVSLGARADLGEPFIGAPSNERHRGLSVIVADVDRPPVVADSADTGSVLEGDVRSDAPDVEALAAIEHDPSTGRLARRTHGS
jgi:hypothetical protein